MNTRMGLVLLLMVVLLATGVRSLSADEPSAPAPPVVTTPTPQPTSTPTPLTLRERLLLTPEAERRGSFVLLPLVLGGEPLQDVVYESFSYVVESGDTLWSLALDFGRDLDTMSCVTTPTGTDAEKLTAGQVIIVPALDDLCYTVTPGDILSGIATRHKVSVDAIIAIPWNGFTEPPYIVQPRQRILLPDARPSGAPRPEREAISYPADFWAATAFVSWPFGDGKFIWPVTGPISQGSRPGHTALDIAVPVGTAVKAADRGTVIMAGWSPAGYGFRVVIDHGIDYVTLYAHLSDIYVEMGQVVGKGQVIGASGANGNITGPHLHFEIRDFGRLIDPLRLLPR